MKTVAVKQGETIDAFATRWGRTIQQVIDDNQQEEILQGKREATSSKLSRRQWLSGIAQLNVPDDANEVGGQQAQQVQLPQTPEPLNGLSNDGLDWLTYETIFNQRPYRKNNQRLELGLYRIPLSRVKIFVRDKVADETLKELCAAFFPDLTPDIVKKVSDQSWDWKKPTVAPLQLPQSPLNVRATRSENTFYAKQYVVLPFNFKDNGENTHAIGHAPKTVGGADIQKLKKTWGFWKTASRSIAVDLQPVKKKGDPWQPIVSKDFSWTFAVLPQRPDASRLGETERGTDLRTEYAKGTQLKLSNQGIKLHGVKTGVQFVGWVDQQGVHKDNLEENSVVACLRSDLIIEMDRLAGRGNPKADPDLVIQTELLSITEVDEAKRKEFCDGIQVRDFTVFDKSKVYFPPLSIPFVDRGLKALKRRYECVGDQQWRDFWKATYAEKLGKAKAILLLRYGMQMGSPNAQNMLLEFDPPAGQNPPQPTGRVFLRDVGDMYLHREVMWARFGGDGDPPQDPADSVKMKDLDCKIIQYEATKMRQKLSPDEEWRDYVPYETGSLYELQYGPRGTRFGWHAFSTLGKGSSVYQASPMGTDPDAYSPVWRETCAAMCEWGIAHNRAYIKQVEAMLGVVLSTDGPAAPDDPAVINWANAPQPSRYTNVQVTDRDAADRLYKEDLAWEKLQGDKLHNYLKSSAGQTKIKAVP